MRGGSRRHGQKGWLDFFGGGCYNLTIIGVLWLRHLVREAGA